MKNLTKFALTFLLSFLTYSLIGLVFHKLNKNVIDSKFSDEQNKLEHKSEEENIKKQSKIDRDLEKVLELTPKIDTWQYIGPKKLRYKVYSAFFDDRVELFGTEPIF